MASEKDFELLDNYISNRMSGQERDAFEQKLAGDPELKSEYDFQQKITEGLKNARIAELKGMLNQVPIPPASSSSPILKATGIVTLTGLVVTALYFYFQRQEPATPAASPITEVIPPPADTTAATPAMQAEDKPLVPVETLKPKIDRKEIPTQSSNTNNNEEQAKEPALDVFDPSQETQSNNLKSELEGDITNNTTSSATATITVETDSNNKKYNFHYQFKDGKLILYGVFEKNLYEILEFFTENKRTLFLYYKNNYYLLREENDKVKPLAAINDAALLKKLKEYRSN